MCRLQFCNRRGDVLFTSESGGDDTVLAFGGEDIPIDDDVVEVEGRLGFDFEGDRLSESSGVGEGKLESPRRELARG